MQPIRLMVRALGAAALTALVMTSLPHTGARAAGPAVQSAPAIDTANFDPTCKPCDDFYQFATGGWSKSHPLPAGRARWGGFDELAQRNRDELHAILDEDAKLTNAPPGSDAQKLGAFYRACMDEDAIEKAGTAPIAALSLGGLGLPDRDYYFNDGDRAEKIRAAYHAYVAPQLQNLGDEPAKAQTEATAVMALETALAKATPKRADMRDPYKLYNPTPVAKLPALAPYVPWAAYFAAFGAPSFDTVIVSVPAYVTAYDEQLSTAPLSTWKSYLRFKLADAYSGALPKRFEDAGFAFRNGVLLGVNEQLPRWQRCTTATDASLRDVLGKAYVAAAFPPTAKTRAKALVDNLQATLREDIGTLDWMTPATQERAREKLAAFTKKIAYPDRWEDYSKVEIVNGAPYAADVLTIRRWNGDRAITRIGTPTDRSRWNMTPPTVNAYYNPSNNEIVFPAGILGPPFFNATADDAVNYGAIGAVIGHEMTHGFDDQGRQFDAQGNLRDWWQPSDAAAFKVKAQCIVDEFDAFEPAPGAHENGRLVQGEAIADLGGLTIAYKAFEKTPDRFRDLGTLSNMPEFQSAFRCAATDAMVRKNRCQIW